MFNRSLCRVFVPFVDVIVSFLCFRFFVEFPFVYNFSSIYVLHWWLILLQFSPPKLFSLQFYPKIRRGGRRGSSWNVSVAKDRPIYEAFASEFETATILTIALSGILINFYFCGMDSNVVFFFVNSYFCIECSSFLGKNSFFHITLYILYISYYFTWLE